MVAGQQHRRHLLPPPDRRPGINRPLEQSRLLITPARLAGQEGVELRCRVGLAKGLWFIAGIVGPARHVNPFAWMQNKRALDVITGSLQFGGESEPAGE